MVLAQVTTAHVPTATVGQAARPFRTAASIRGTSAVGPMEAALVASAFAVLAIAGQAAWSARTLASIHVTSTAATSTMAAALMSASQPLGSETGPLQKKVGGLNFRFGIPITLSIFSFRA